MPKVLLNNLSSLANETSAIALINANNDAIEEGFNLTISRDGTSPNTFEADLDMNNNRVYNVQDPILAQDAATKSYVDGIALDGSVPIGVEGPLSSTDGNLASFSGTDGQTIQDSGIASADVLETTDIGVTVQAYDAQLDTWSGVTPSANGQSLVSAANYAAMRALLDLEAGTDFYSIAAADAAFEPIDADILKADTPDTLTAGFAHTVDNDGTQSSGTYTPDQDGGNMKRIVNGGAFTLAPPTDDCCIILQITNNASAGAITTSGFTGVFGDSFTTTNGDDFICTIIKINGFSSLTVQDVS